MTKEDRSFVKSWPFHRNAAFTVLSLGCVIDGLLGIFKHAPYSGMQTIFALAMFAITCKLWVLNIKEHYGAGKIKPE